MPDDKLLATVAADAAPSARPQPASARGRDARLMVLALLLLAVALAAARAGRWTAGSDAGYWLGVAAGVSMLLLLAYPLRKRLRLAQRLGRMRGWFALHMLLGIGTPLLVILHSRLAFGSINATVAFGVMALVAGSGFVGRFLYARIHHGLYGDKATLAELRRVASDGADAMHVSLALVPEVVARLEAFASSAEAAGGAGLRRPLAVLALGLRAPVVRARCRRELRLALAAQACIDGWDRERLARRLARRRELVDRYVAAVVHVGQFSAFERLFSWWHVLHVPLVWLLVASVLAHVVAVHMY